MAGLDEGVKEELAKAATCGEFKGTFLKIFEALLAPNYEDRKKPKLSFFDGKSFDKMCQKISKLFSSFKIEKNSQKIISEDREKLLKILKEYKGRKSPHKLLVTKKVINALESKGYINTYAGIIKLVNSKLMSLYGLDDVVHSNKKYIPAEMELWNKINYQVSKWKDDELISNVRFGFLSASYDGDRSKISKNKEEILSESMNIMKENATRNDAGLERCKNNLDDVEKEINLHSKLEQFKDLVTNSWDYSWRIDKDKADAISVDGGDILKTLEKASDVDSVWMNIIAKWDSSFSVKDGRLEVSNGAKIADWRKVLENILDYHSRIEMAQIAKQLRESYCEIENAKDPDEVFSNFEHSLKVYSAHKNNANAKRVFEYLKKGLELYTGAEGVYKVLFPKLTRDYIYTRDYLKRECEKTIDRCNSEKYDISKTKVFIEKLKKEKF